MTPQSHLGGMFQGQGAAQGGQPEPDGDEQQAAPDLGTQLRSIMLTAVTIARSNPATAAAMRTIIQAAQQAAASAQQSAGQGGGPPSGPASPQPANY